MDGRILALVSGCFFSIGPVILAIGFRQASPDQALLVSALVGLPLLLGLAPALGGLDLDQLTLRPFLLFSLAGFLGPLLGRLFLYNSIQRLGSSRAFTIYNSAPLITAAAAFVVLGELVTLWRWVAIASIVIGLGIVSAQSRLTPNPMRLSGITLAFMAAISFGVRPVVVKLGLRDHPQAMTASIVAAAAALVGVVVYLAFTGRIRKLSFSKRSVMLFTLVAIVHNLGFLAINFAFSLGDVSQVYPINASSPLLTFAMSYFILHNDERLSIVDLVGIVAVVAGVGMLFA